MTWEKRILQISFFSLSTGSTTSSTALQNESELGDDDVFTVSVYISVTIFLQPMLYTSSIFIHIILNVLVKNQAFWDWKLDESKSNESAQTGVFSTVMFVRRGQSGCICALAAEEVTEPSGRACAAVFIVQQRHGVWKCTIWCNS